MSVGFMQTAEDGKSTADRGTRDSPPFSFLSHHWVGPSSPLLLLLDWDLHQWLPWFSGLWTWTELHYGVSWVFPDSSVGKESACSAGDPGSIPELGRSAGEGIGYPLQYSWVSLVAQLVKNPPGMWETWVRSLGWRFPGEGKGYPLQYSGLENSTGLQIVRHNWATFTFTFQLTDGRLWDLPFKSHEPIHRNKSMYMCMHVYIYIIYNKYILYNCCCSVAKSHSTLCNLMDYSMPGSSVLHYLLEFAQIHVHWVSYAI